MEFLFKGLNEDCSPSQTECPFLRNINDPTNFSFSTAMPFSMPAAKAAAISLSSFGPFSFDAFSNKRNNQQGKSKSSKKESSSQVVEHLIMDHVRTLLDGGNSNHEALGNEWVQNGNCPIAKSYSAVSGVLTLVAKVFQPPPGDEIQVPTCIVAARAALAQTMHVCQESPPAIVTHKSRGDRTGHRLEGRTTPIESSSGKTVRNWPGIIDNGIGKKNSLNNGSEELFLEMGMMLLYNWCRHPFHAIPKGVAMLSSQHPKVSPAVPSDSQRCCHAFQANPSREWPARE
ncbi:Pseudouridine synthase family protein [Hibiscus syriacus]|uniref:Pseudouridine synthase family protein n=1 Tax=Hibiscus syriacus TaxID=106335 RepID=A0A6A2XJD3_HIBSY|nr:Pseudouridine synthase family protein [Hibiscus syriacus]